MRLLRPAARALAWAASAVVVAVPLTAPGGPLAFAFAASYDPPLTISGSIDGLPPGEPSSLVLTVTNPTGHGMVVGTLSARVAGASAGCPAGPPHSEVRSDCSSPS